MNGTSLDHTDRPGINLMTLVAGGIAVVAVIVAVVAASSAAKANKSAADLKSQLGRMTVALETMPQMEARIGTCEQNLRGLANETSAYLNNLQNQITKLRTPPPSPTPMPPSGGGSAAGAGGAAPAPAGYTEYTIKERDLASRVAAAHGVKLADLIKANPGVDLDRVKVGQKIRIPKK